METMLKCSALALSCAAVCLLIKGKNPELSLLLAALVSVMTALAGFKLGGSIRELADAVKLIIGTANTNNCFRILPSVKSLFFAIAD